MACERRFSVSVPVELASELEKIAEAEGCSVSWLFRRWTQQGLKAYKKEGHL